MLKIVAIEEKNKKKTVKCSPKRNWLALKAKKNKVDTEWKKCKQIKNCDEKRPLEKKAK